MFFIQNKPETLTNIMKFKLLIICLLLCSCKRKSPVESNPALEEFKRYSSYGVYIDGKPTMVYAATEHQMAINSTRNTFRIQTDDQSMILHFALSLKPDKIGQELAVDLTAHGVPNIATSQSTVKVVKIVSETAWLWDSKQVKGFITKIN